MWDPESIAPSQSAVTLIDVDGALPGDVASAVHIDVAPLVRHGFLICRNDNAGGCQERLRTSTKK